MLSSKVTSLVIAPKAEDVDDHSSQMTSLNSGTTKSRGLEQT